ncbi:MAG: helix-turn-helix domain-containing protein [Candidatus Bathyarchaeia archaeon]
MAYREKLPYRTSIEIVNERCKVLKLFKDLGIHQFRVVDIRRLPRGVTRHLVRIPVKQSVNILKCSNVKMRSSIKLGKESIAWFESDGCDVCNTIVSKGAFLTAAWSVESSRLVYTFVSPNTRIVQDIVSTLEELGFEPKILGVERFRGRGLVLTEKQEMALRMALEMGFFDYPKKSTISDISRKLGISSSTLSERMRRGIRRLLEYYFEYS